MVGAGSGEPFLRLCCVVRRVSVLVLSWVLIDARRAEEKMLSEERRVMSSIVVESG